MYIQLEQNSFNHIQRNMQCTCNSAMKGSLFLSGPIVLTQSDARQAFTLQVICIGYLTSKLWENNALQSCTYQCQIYRVFLFDDTFLTSSCVRNFEDIDMQFFANCRRRMLVFSICNKWSFTHYFSWNWKFEKGPILPNRLSPFWV